MTKCTKGNCGQLLGGVEIPEPVAPFHDIQHDVQGVREAMHAGLRSATDGLQLLGTQFKAVQDAVAQLSNGQQTLATGLAGITPRHATLEEVRESAETDDCPECKTLWQSLQPKPAPTPAPKAEATPEPPPKTPVPIVVTGVSSGSPLTLAAYRIKIAYDDDGAMNLVTDDEEAAKEAVTDGVVPRCRWVKRKDGTGFLACKEE